VAWRGAEVIGQGDLRVDMIIVVARDLVIT
jgi:hypothetical protein